MGLGAAVVCVRGGVRAPRVVRGSGNSVTCGYIAWESTSVSSMANSPYFSTSSFFASAKS